MNLPKVPQPFIVKAIAIALCGLAAVSIPHPGVSACAQVLAIEVMTVGNVQRLCGKLKGMQSRCCLQKLGQQKQKRTDKDKK